MRTELHIRPHTKAEIQMKKLTILTLTLLLTALVQLTAQPVQAEVSIPDDNLANAIRETLNLPTDAVITADAMLNLTELEARGKGITDLTGLEHAVNLTWLDLSGTGVGDEWHTNSISDVSPLAALTQLTTLSLAYTGVSDISPLAALTQLTWLSLDATAVSDVSPLAALTQLTTLFLYYTDVSDVSPLANLTQLTTLFLYYTDVSDVSPLANLTQLTTLDLGGTDVSDISPLSALSQLKTLYLNYTDVSDISPLSALSQLTRLGLIDTAVSDISPLSALSQLTWLSLDGTGVSDISPLTALTQLVELNLNDCPLNADAYQTHIPAIQANGTEVAFDPFKPIHLQRVPSLVSLIYFRPSDKLVRPNVDAVIDRLIKKAQRFFADEMERHGFGRKTFQFEADANGNAVVHHVNGKFTEAYYRQNGGWGKEIGEQIYIPRQSIVVEMLDGDLLPSAGIGGGSPYGGGGATINWWAWSVIAHELGHAFGMTYHDFRDDRYIMSYGSDEELSPCFAAWLDVHPAFNPTVVRIGTRATIQMLPATLAAPPNTIRLRFTVTAPAGSLYQARLLTPEKTRFGGYDFDAGGLIGCKRIDGNPTSSTVEFVTALTPDTESVSLQIIGIDGDRVAHGEFPIDVASLIPPAKVVSIPDPNLAAAVRESLNMSSGESVTTHSILNLVELEAPNRGIKSLTGLEHAVNLKEVDLGWEYISGEGLVNSNAISDWSPLANLPQLTSLDLRSTAISDVSPLSGLTQLSWLRLNFTAVSDVSPLSALTQLTRLELVGTAVSDVSPLANLTQLKTLALDRRISRRYIESYSEANLTHLEDLNLSSIAVSDVSPLANLTQLEFLSLGGTAVSDVSPLSALTQLTQLDLNYTAVSDVSPLANLTQLEHLNLSNTNVSDVSPLLGLDLPGRFVDGIGLDLRGSPLSYASIHTHIPAMQAKGRVYSARRVYFDNVAHPALLKTSGDRQEGVPSATLQTPFVVEAMDEHGKPIVGKTVVFEIRHGGGTLNANTVKTDARGKAQITLTLGRASGINKVKASSEGIQSYVLFTAVGTGAAPQLVADVNGDGIVNIQDLVLVAGQFGKTGKHSADVNGDGFVNIQDLVLVAGAFGEGAAAPSARAVSLSRLTVSDVEGWLVEARVSIRSGSGDASRPGGLSYLRGLAVLEQLLASLTPKATALLPNYPNPFNPETWIPYQLANPAEVTVTIYAANGAVVRTLDLGHQRAGSYASRSRAAYWDGRNAQGEPVASGVYFYTLSAGDFKATRKMVIRK